MTAEKIASDILVVGSDGLIGGALMEELRQAGERAVGTTRRRGAVDEARHYLDLSENVEQWQPPRPVSVAVICAGVTKIDLCRRDPESTARVNVEAVSVLASNLVGRGAFVIYLSTNQVFDGMIPNRLPLDPALAQTEYGRQKAEVERRLLALGNSTSIVRLTKVIGPGMPLLKGWLRALHQGEMIHPFVDMVMAPVPLSFVTAVIRQLVERRLPGIVQVSGERDVTYAQVAYHIAERTGAKRELVQPISSKEAGIPAEAAPPHTTLDTTRLRRELGLEPPDVWTTIDSAISL